MVQKARFLVALFLLVATFRFALAVVGEELSSCPILLNTYSYEQIQRMRPARFVRSPEAPLPLKVEPGGLELRALGRTVVSGEVIGKLIAVGYNDQDLLAKPERFCICPFNPATQTYLRPSWHVIPEMPLAVFSDPMHISPNLIDKVWRQIARAEAELNDGPAVAVSPLSNEPELLRKQYLKMLQGKAFEYATSLTTIAASNDTKWVWIRNRSRWLTATEALNVIEDELVRQPTKLTELRTLDKLPVSLSDASDLYQAWEFADPHLALGELSDTFDNWSKTVESESKRIEVGYEANLELLPEGLKPWTSLYESAISQRRWFRIRGDYFSPAEMLENHVKGRYQIPPLPENVALIDPNESLLFYADLKRQTSDKLESLKSKLEKTPN